VEAALARAERERLVRPGELEALLSRCSRRPGVPLLRRLLKQQHGPALTRSEAESLFLDLVRRAGLPAPEANARLAGFEIDFLWRDLGVAVEVDGYRFHGARARFEGDRRRITRLASRGIQVIPVTWRQIVDDGVATAVQIGQALVQAEHRH
jgi:very-short-patch-repair endonuclease